MQKQMREEKITMINSMNITSNYSATKASVRRKLVERLGSDFNKGMNDVVMAKSRCDFERLVPKEDFIIYIHIPFCDSFCRDCPYSKSVNKGSVEKYVRALVKEIEFIGKNKKDSKIRAKAVYFGGGTPTVLSANLLSDIIGKLKKYFVDESTSITLESHPKSLDCDNLLKYRDAGINRISLGIQSFHDSVLKEMGREYDSNRAIEVAKKVSENGWNFNIDIMYGFDSETEEMFYEDLDKAIELNADHISIYGLMRNTDSKTKEAMIKNETDMYFYARKRLLDEGFLHYKINDFARNDKSINIYADLRDRIPLHENLALGTSGHGMTYSAGNYLKYRSIDKYIECIEKEIPPLYYVNCNDKEGDIVSNIFYGLNSLNISREKFKKQFGTDPVDNTTGFIRHLARLGFLEITDKEVKLREDSIFEYNILFNEVYYKGIKMPKDADIK